MLGILVVILTVGTVILGKETAAVAAPPLTGGFVAATVSYTHLDVYKRQK